MSREECKRKRPKLREVKSGHCVACHYYEESQSTARKLEAKTEVEPGINSAAGTVGGM